MNSNAVKTVIDLLNREPLVSDYKINVAKKESFELFFVKGKLETVRSTDTCDRKVTVYADHDGFRGDAVFYLYPSTTGAQMKEKIAEAAESARMIRNEPYVLPQEQEEENTLVTNLEARPMPELANLIAELVFSANTLEGGSLNSVEVFVSRHTESVCNSRGLHKTQHRYSAMVEAIPTFNGDRESVELYEQYNFTSLDEEALVEEIAEKMTAVQARYEAVKPDFALDCPVVLHKQELGELFGSFASDLNYSTVYSHSNLFSKGDRIQETDGGDHLTITMKGQVLGCSESATFDGDGMSLGEMTLVEDGTVKNYYGSSRFGQYLGEEAPTGNLGCLCVAPGTAAPIQGQPWLEVLSMSGLQVDFFNDYVGGEIRLARYHDGEKILPVTGISVSGKLRQVLESIRLSPDTAIHDGYVGPAWAILRDMKIF